MTDEHRFGSPPADDSNTDQWARDALTRARDQHAQRVHTPNLARLRKQAAGRRRRRRALGTTAVAAAVAAVAVAIPVGVHHFGSGGTEPAGSPSGSPTATPTGTADTCAGPHSLKISWVRNRGLGDGRVWSYFDITASGHDAASVRCFADGYPHVITEYPSGHSPYSAVPYQAPFNRKSPTPTQVPITAGQPAHFGLLYTTSDASRCLGPRTFKSVLIKLPPPANQVSRAQMPPSAVKICSIDGVMITPVSAGSARSGGR